MGVYKRKGSRYYWMCYSVNGAQERSSTKTSSKAVATRIWKQREVEVALGLFNVGWPGERMSFEELCEEYKWSHIFPLLRVEPRGFRESPQASGSVLGWPQAD